MGGNASDAEPEELEVGMPGLAKATADLAARHGLNASHELERVIDTLFGLSCRDQETEYSSPDKMAQRRKKGHEAARRMKVAARQMLTSLAALHDSMQQFDEVVRSNPGLLEAIFDVDTGKPTELTLPVEIAILQTCFRSAFDDEVERTLSENEEDLGGQNMPASGDFELEPTVPFKRCAEGFWEEVDDRLSAVAALPLRATLSRGPVPNFVLRSSLRVLRSYWRGSVEKSWAMSSLRHAEVRRENDPNNLVGRCERFVVDALFLARIRFSFAELASTWTSVDLE